MKKIIIPVLLLAAQFSFQQVCAQEKTATATIASTVQLTAKEKDDAVKLLSETETGVFNSVKGLSAAQLAFKPAADKWSVEEGIKHIAAAEKSLWAMVDDLLKQPANPEKRAEIKFTDADLVKAVEDRSHKSKTFAMLEPANSPYKTTEEALVAFKENREKLIDFIKTTQLDLRNHVAVLPIGTYDAYQFVLLIASHSNRHTQQIEEVKANEQFPKN
ncbi:DinB family protein [Ferruginibacter sp. HRS2-29]|uniref:DinB family protein n=1 Tax=Ferruginibacter sp. HRS2-29 TaxID=2487334 RepID=UPI0020CB795A|nr:DinB family protein [Ferruginibacter sp. HRS2-29]MCP9750650.1 DinB family protein [Ferruginibacter sp. HRS2-29]